MMGLPRGSVPLFVAFFLVAVLFFILGNCAHAEPAHCRLEWKNEAPAGCANPSRLHKQPTEAHHAAAHAKHG